MSAVDTEADIKSLETRVTYAEASAAIVRFHTP